MKIALIPSLYLGDTLLTFIIANNLQRNNYQVTLFSNFAYQMSQWFPNITIEPLAELKNLNKVANKFDLIICDFAAAAAILDAFIDTLPKELFILFNLSRKPDNELLTKWTKEQKISPLQKFNKANGIALGTLLGDIPFVPKICYYCKEFLSLDNVIESNGITPP